MVSYAHTLQSLGECAQGRIVFIMAHRREPKDFISPLLQPPLNKLFVPRPTPDFLPPIDRADTERTWVKVHPTSQYLSYLSETSNSSSPDLQDAQVKGRDDRVGEKQAANRATLEQEIVKCTCHYAFRH